MKTIYPPSPVSDSLDTLATLAAAYPGLVFPVATLAAVFLATLAARYV